jgi:hypothetical protein
MDNTIPAHLIDQFFAIIDKGDEEKARKFLLEHLKEFPEESKNAIIAAFVEEAITKQADGSALIAALKNEGLKTAHTMSTFKKEGEKQAELERIKRGI